MKKLSLILVLILALTCTMYLPAQAETAEAYDDMLTFSAEGISFAYPSDWLVMDMNGTLFFAYITLTGSNVNVTYADLGTNISATQISQLVFPTALAQYQASYDNVEQLEADPTVQVGDYEYAELAVSMSYQDIPMQIEQYALCNNGRMYVITYTFVAGEEADETNLLGAVLMLLSATYE